MRTWVQNAGTPTKIWVQGCMPVMIAPGGGDWRVPGAYRPNKLDPSGLQVQWKTLTHKRKRVESRWGGSAGRGVCYQAWPLHASMHAVMHSNAYMRLHKWDKCKQYRQRLRETTKVGVIYTCRHLCRVDTRTHREVSYFSYHGEQIFILRNDLLPPVFWVLPKADLGSLVASSSGRFVRHSILFPCI